MRNWKSTISGSFAALGVFLFGAPAALKAIGLAVFPDGWIKWLAISGVAMQGLGVFFGHLFSADASAVKNLGDRVDDNEQAILSGNTAHLLKGDAPPEAVK